MQIKVTAGAMERQPCAGVVSPVFPLVQDNALFTLIISVILNPPLSGLMILVSIHFWYVSLFSKYTMYISKDYDLE